MALSRTHLVKCLRSEASDGGFLVRILELGPSAVANEGELSQEHIAVQPIAIGY